MGIRFDPDEPAGRARPGALARLWNSLRSPQPLEGRHPSATPPPAWVQEPTGVQEPAWSPEPVPPATGGRLTADEVSAVRFRPSSFREGYDQTEVDGFLDRIEAALRERAAGRPGSLTSADVVNQMFQATRFRQGYDQDEVDAFLDRAAKALA